MSGRRVKGAQGHVRCGKWRAGLSDLQATREARVRAGNTLVTRRDKRQLWVTDGFILFVITGVAVSGVHCAEPAVLSIASEPVLRWGSWTWTQHLAVRGASDRQLVFGARIAGSLRGPLGARFLARVDASAIGDGGAVGNVDVTDPKTFQTLEAYAGVYRPVLPGLAVIAIGGVTLPIVDGSPDIVNPHPKTIGAGLSAALDEHHESYVVAMLGAHQAAGSGLKLLLAGQFQLLGATYLIGDAALGGAGSYVRGGVALRVK